MKRVFASFKADVSSRKGISFFFYYKLYKIIRITAIWRMLLKFLFLFFFFIRHTFLLSLSQHTQNTLQLYHEMSVIVTPRRERKQSRHLDVLYVLKNRLDALSSGRARTASPSAAGH